MPHLQGRRLNRQHLEHRATDDRIWNRETTVVAPKIHDPAMQLAQSRMALPYVMELSDEFDRLPWPTTILILLNQTPSRELAQLWRGDSDAVVLLNGSSYR